MLSTAVAPAPRCSLVIPVYNEGEVIAEVLQEIREFLASHPLDEELLVVDDGSGDGTAQLVEDLLAGWPRARLLSLPRNLGQAAALYLGMQRARGGVIILMDGDGQNDPRDIPRLLAALQQVSADMAVGVRVPRSDPWPRRWMSRFANRVRRRVLQDGMTDTGCGLKAFHRRVVAAFIPIQTLYSFMPALAMSAGFSVVELPVRHRPRPGGRSKYGVRHFLWRPLLDLLGVWWFTRRRCPLAVGPAPGPVGFGDGETVGSLPEHAATSQGDDTWRSRHGG